MRFCSGHVSASSLLLRGLWPSRYDRHTEVMRVAIRGHSGFQRVASLSSVGRVALSRRGGPWRLIIGFGTLRFVHVGHKTSLLCSLVFCSRDLRLKPQAIKTPLLRSESQEDQSAFWLRSCRVLMAPGFRPSFCGFRDVDDVSFLRSVVMISFRVTQICM